MRRSTGCIVLALLVLAAAPALALTFESCWVTQEIDRYGIAQQVTRCRIAGGDVVNYASDADVPSVLYPNTGTDLTGQCWYYTSAATQYVILVQYANGDADIGFDTDPANPGGIVAIGPTLPRCTSEPIPVSDPLAEAWEYVMQYIHDPPAPDLNPRPGDGVTGLGTFVGVIVPEDHSATLSSGATTLEVFIEVSAVIVDWGDGSTDTYPPTAEAMAGYPSGFAVHTYETKDQAGVPLVVSYDWTARWRIVADAWQVLPVPNTTTTTIYPIAEIVSTLTG